MPETVRSSKRVALVFYGKHGDTTGRSSSLLSKSNASWSMLRDSHASWMQRLVLGNPSARFDVIAHSWSPEVVETFAELWGPLLVRARHDPTAFVSSSSSRLAWRCAVEQINCARTISQLLSLSKAVALKREQELLTGRPYDFVIVARHDLLFASAWMLSGTQLSASSQSDDRSLWLPGSCRAQVCEPLSGQVPRGCSLTGQGCLMAVAHGAGREWMMATDWLFGCSSHVADTMGETISHFQEYSAELVARWPYSATHFLWPLHAWRCGLQIRWDLMQMQFQQIALARGAHTPKPSCLYKTNLRPARRVNESQLRHAAIMNAQCPHATALSCSCSHGAGLGLERLA